MMERLKTIGSIFIILLLFPYVTVMLAGRQAGSNAHGQGILSDEKNGQETDSLSSSEALENWILWILPAQMPVTYELEALKAQAVLVRSSLAYHMQQEGIGPEQVNEKKLEEWELQYYSPLQLEEIWGDSLFETYYGKIYQAVQETCGKVLTYEGNYVELPYHAVSAGKTRDGSLLGDGYPYLKAVECPGDLEAENFLSLVQKEFAETLKIISRDDSGYVTEVRLGEEQLAGEEFRHQENLASSCFTLQEQEGSLVIATKGLGHGFGLSMYQAQLQACQGKTFLEILEYFYTGLECISFS